MKSHQGHFSYSDLLKLVMGPLLPLALFALLMQAGYWMNWLPQPWPALDMDRAVLTYQARAAQTPQETDILLLGDSSCLMGVSAPALARQIKSEVLSLATLSFVDLSAHSLMLRTWAKANPGQPVTVILLMHPEALRRPEPSAYHQDFLVSLLQGRSPSFRSGFFAQVQGLLGLEALRNRVLGRILPIPLPGRYGFYYGFTTDLCRYLAQNRGSAVDPNTYHPETDRGNAEYRLARGLEERSAFFRRQFPPGARLAVGLTPSPASFVAPRHAELSRTLLTQWGAWLQADQILTNLPSILPDSCFASPTHLNEAGQSLFTQQLAEKLSLRSSVTPRTHP